MAPEGPAEVLRSSRIMEYEGGDNGDIVFDILMNRSRFEMTIQGVEGCKTTI